MNLTENNYDTLLKNEWNKRRAEEAISEEQLWDLCRIFEAAGMLKGNSSFVGVGSIGPFHVAYKDVSKIDILEFFAGELMPALIAINNTLTFAEIYGLFLFPAAFLCAKASSKIFIIKDPLEWEILLLIKHLNQLRIYPTPEELISRQEFQNVDRVDVYNAFKSLSEKASFLNEEEKLIEQYPDRRLKCVV